MVLQSKKSKTMVFKNYIFMYKPGKEIMDYEVRKWITAKLN